MSDGQVWRTGRTLGRTLYIQVGAEPSKADRCVGMVDSPALADRVVGAVNGATAEVERLRAIAETHHDSPSCSSVIDKLRTELEQAEDTIERVRAAVADVQRCQEALDPSERMRCAMCGGDHFADLAAALAPAPSHLFGGGR